MSATRPPPATGYVHQAALYGSDQELTEAVVPFLLGGLDAGEAVIAALGPHEEALVRSEVPPDAGVAFLSGSDHYVRPAIALRTFTARFEEALAGGAERIRVVGSVPHRGRGACWEEWLRYEMAATRTFGDLPLWGVCPYDTRIAPDDVIDDVLAVHPFVGQGPAPAPNPAYAAGSGVLADRPAPPSDPLEREPAAVVHPGPSPAEARTAASVVAQDAGLDGRRTEDLLVVVSELITNGYRHGVPPVTLELWAEPGRVLVLVSDAGAGPADPLVGLTRQDQAIGGMGLWITHQLADHVRLDAGGGRFTVRASIRA